MWGPDIAPVTPQKALFQFSLAILAFASFGVLVKYALVPDQIAVRREYPFSGLVAELGGLEENKVSCCLSQHVFDHTLTNEAGEGG